MPGRIAILSAFFTLLTASFWGCDGGCPSGTQQKGQVCQRPEPAATGSAGDGEMESADTGSGTASGNVTGASSGRAEGGGSASRARGSAGSGYAGSSGSNGGTSGAPKPANGASGGAGSSCIPTTSGAMDGCCPTGANANIDPDCQPACGNGALEKGEACDPPSTCPTTCPSADPCLMAKVDGDPMLCTAKCTMVAVKECVSGDKCCPDGCVNATDSDCSKSCGDGVVDEPTETCEPNSKTEPCPVSCDDGMACTEDIKSGSSDRCNVVCTHNPITMPTAGDGCCPPGADANSDADCMPTCGNNKKEAGEKCDGDCPKTCANKGCQSFVLQGTGCQVECTAGPQITKPANGDGCCPESANVGNDNDCETRCGDGVVSEPQETCDPKSSTVCATKSSCVSAGCMSATFSGSTEQCTAKCDRKTITNMAPGDGCCPKGANASQDTDCDAVCGNGVTEPGEECDLGAPSTFPDKRPYDKWSCDSRCRRLYDYTPCTSSADCGGQVCAQNGVCATPCSNTQAPYTCFTSSGVEGYCYAYCNPYCDNDQSRCPHGTTCSANAQVDRPYICI